MVKNAWGIIPDVDRKKTALKWTTSSSKTNDLSESETVSSTNDGSSTNESSKRAGKRFKEIAGRIGKEQVMKKQRENLDDRMIYTFTEALQAALADGVSKKRIPWYILMPNNNFRRIWEAILSLLLVYTLIFLPIHEVFNSDASYTTFDLTIDILFIFDVFITLFSAYEDSWGDLVTDPKLIAKNYFKSWFWIDAVSSFPFALIPDVPYDRLSFLTSLGKGLKIPRLIFRALRMLKLMRAYRFRKFFYELEFSPLVHQGFVRGLKVLLLVVVIVHFSACLWYKVGDLAQQNENAGSWLDNMDKDILNSASTGYLYLMSLYWATQTLTTVGYGDIIGRSPAELIVSMVIMTIGATTFSYITATVSSILQTSDGTSNEYRARMHKVSLFLNEKQLPSRLQVRVIQEVGSYYRKAVSQSQNWVSLMQDMSPKLQKEIIAHTFKDIIKMSSFVRHVNNADFHTELFASCEEIYLQPGQYLTTAGFPCDSWYFVRRGVLTAVSSGDSNVIYRKYGVGQSFGESCIFLTTTWFASIRCLYSAVVLRLPIQKLLRVAGSHAGITSLLIDLATTDYAKLCLAKKNVDAGSLSADSPQGGSSRSRSTAQFNRYQSKAKVVAGLSDLSRDETEFKSTLTPNPSSSGSSETAKTDTSIPDRIDQLETMINQLIGQIDLLTSVARL